MIRVRVAGVRSEAPAKRASPAVNARFGPATSLRRPPSISSPANPTDLSLVRPDGSSEGTGRVLDMHSP